MVMGLDIGSAASKAVALDEKKRIRGNVLIPLGTGSTGPVQAVEKLEKICGERFIKTVVTGYGRKTWKEAQKEVSELSCHAKGAEYLSPGTTSVLDIGGQDVKVLEVQNGKLMNFIMNDKCAAGTGRFLEVMANILEVRLSEMETLALEAEETVAISSICTVFAESEVISRLAEGKNRSAICAGIHEAVAAKAVGLAGRMELGEKMMITGGAAANRDLVQRIERKLGKKVMCCEMAQYAGAIGAALFALELLKKEGV